MTASVQEAGARPPGGRRRWSTKTPYDEKRPGRTRRALVRSGVGWSFIGPGAFVILGLSVFPAVWAFFLSREKWNGFSEPKNVGWANYQRMVDDPDLISAVRHTLVYTALYVPTSIIGGMFLAVALNRQIRFISFYRTCIFVPFVASAAATGILGTYVFNPQFGVANNLLRVAHLPEQGFLEDRHQALVIIAVMSLWAELGFVVVVYLAALQDIPKDLVEAARCDGAVRLAGLPAHRAARAGAGHRVRHDLADHHGDPALRPGLRHDPRRSRSVRPRPSSTTSGTRPFAGCGSATDRRWRTGCSRSPC